MRKLTNTQVAAQYLAARNLVNIRGALCGCYSVSTDLRKQYLPLLDCEAHATILSRTFKTVVQQTFVNSSSSENTTGFKYDFPLYDGVSVVAFKCKIGSKPAVYGVVKERKKAETIFDTAVAKGDNAGLLTQAPETSDVFSTKIGNVSPGENVFVEIIYIGELKHDDATGGTRFTFPAILAPLYSPQQSVSLFSAPRSAGAMIPLPDHGGQISVIVDIALPAGIHIKEIESLAHMIAISIGTISTAAQAVPMKNKASATLSLRSAVLVKDFILIIRSNDTGRPKALLETHPAISNHRALMITLAPKASLHSSSPSEIVLVADRSASMTQNISMLVSAFKVFLKSMPTSINFNICSFGTGYTFLWPQSQSYTSETLQEAIQHLSTFDAHYGGTEIFQAIQATIERRLTDLPLKIILFTNGNITDRQSLFTYINNQVEKSSRAALRVFCLGIGSQVSHALIDGVARAGKGLFLAVQDGERLEKSVSLMLRGVLSPHIGDCVLEVQYGQDDDDYELVDKVRDGREKLLPSSTQEVTTLIDTTVKAMETDLPETHHFPPMIQAPQKIPFLFTVAKKTVYILISPKMIQRNPTSVILRSLSSPGGPPILEIPIEVLPERGTAIHQLAARKAAQDIEESRGWMFDNTNSIADNQIVAEKEAVRLGETFQVVNKWCSFVIVSSKDSKVNLIENTISFPRDLPIRPFPSL